MSIKIINNLSNVITDDRNNNYENFEIINNDYGVYIFKEKDTNKILYIGEAKKQTLKDRIIQNFKENDTGGTFRKNYIEQENANFNDFKNLIKTTEIITIVCPKNIIISALEAILINVLKPNYNKDI